MVWKFMRNIRIHNQMPVRRVDALDDADPCVLGVEIGSEYGVHPCVWELLLVLFIWLGGLSRIVVLGTSGVGG